MVGSAGQIVSVTPGTLVRASANMPQPTVSYVIHGIQFQALPTNVGVVYIGGAGMVRGTGVGVLARLPLPTANFLASFSTTLTIAPNGLNLIDFYIDADNASDGVLIAFLRA